MPELAALPDPAGPTGEAVQALRALVLAAQGFRQELANALDLTISDTLALSHLAAAGTLSAGELAQRAGLAPSSITAMLDRLERARLVRRAVRPGNRRAQDITLTERGVDAMALSTQWTGAAFGTLPPAELPQIIRLLNALAAALRGETDAFGAALSAGSIEALLLAATDSGRAG